MFIRQHVRIVQKAREDANIEIGDQDIIRSKGEGYRINEGVNVVVGARRLVAAWNVPDQEIDVADGCSQKTAKRDLSDLREKRLVRFVGSPRSGHYRLV